MLNYIIFYNCSIIFLQFPRFPDKFELLVKSKMKSFPDCAKHLLSTFFEFGALFCILSTLKHFFVLWATF